MNEKEEILDKEEKEYLRAVIKPFRNIIRNITKRKCIGIEKEYIYIDLDGSCMSFPNFKPNTMYKGMEIYKEYTLEELDL